MRYFTTGLIVLSLISVNANPASAESASQAMREFGLTGTWAIDCTEDPKLMGSRIKFTAPYLFDEPTMEIGGKTFKIREAKIMTEDKIEIKPQLPPEAIQAAINHGDLAKVESLFDLYTKMENNKIRISDQNPFFNPKNNLARTFQGIACKLGNENSPPCPHSKPEQNILERCSN